MFRIYHSLGSNYEIFTGFPGGTSGKEPAVSAGDIRDAGSVPGSGRSPGEGNGCHLQYSCLERSMDRGVWWTTVHKVVKSQPWLKWLRSSSMRLLCSHLSYISHDFASLVVELLSHVHSYAIPWTIAHHVPVYAPNPCPWDFPGKNLGMGYLSFSRESSLSSNQSHVSCVAGGFFTAELPVKPNEPTGIKESPYIFYSSR